MGLNLSGSWQQGTLPLTIPRRVFKSSAKDSTRRSVGIVLQGGPRGSSTARAWPTARASGAKRPLLQVGNRTAGARVASSPDSDLEAFSHNPTHGSFAPLAFQPSAMTNCANQRFLSKSRHRRSKSNVAMNAWLPQASYPCGNFSDTSSFKFRRSKGSIGHAFTVRIRTGNQNQTSFYPFVPHEISVLVELILGHLRYLLTDVPPQPNSPPDNVFRPDRPPKRPWVQKEGQRPASDSRNNQASRDRKPVPLAVVSLDSRQGQWESHDEAFGYLKRVIVTPAVYPRLLNFFTLTFRALGRNHIARIPLVRTSSESTVRRPGRPPKGPFPVRPPAGTRRPALAAGAARAVHRQPTGSGLGPPSPALRANPFPEVTDPCRLLAYIVPSTRGCSPWRPDAVMSTTGRGRHSVLRIFKGRRGRTGHHATCGALPAAGPYLRLSRFQGGRADRLTHVQVPFTWNLSPLRPSKFSFEYLLLPPRSAPTAAPPGLAPGFAATAAPSYSSGPGACPDGRVSAQLGTVTRLPVHPASPVLLTKNGPLGALDSVARLNEAAAPSYLFKGNFGGNQLLDGSISLSPLYQVRRTICTSVSLRASPEFPLASPRSGIVHHLSGPDRHALTRTLLRRSRSVGGATLEGSRQSASLRLTGYSPVDSHTCQTPWSVFQDGTNGSPQADARSAHSTIAATASPQAFQRPGLRPPPRSASVHARADRRTGCRRSTSDRGASPAPIHFPDISSTLDSLQILFIFPSRYLFAIGLSPYLALTNLPPDWGCIPKQPDSQTAPRGAAGSSHDGALTLSGAPFQGTWAWSAAEDASPDYNSNAAGARFSSWAFPGSLAVTRGILSRLTWGRNESILESQCSGSGRSRGRQARARPCPRVSTSCRATAAEDSILGQHGGSARRPVSAPPSQTCPRPGGLGRNLRSKTRWFTGFCNSHQVSHFATFFIDARAEISVAESRSDYHKKKARPRHRGYEGGLLVLNFLGASRAGVRWRAVWAQMRPSTARVDTRAGFDNDPSAGSPTETLLRLLLPLNDKVQWTSRDVASGEPPTSPRSEHFTGPFNRPVIASNFLGLEGHSPSKKLAAEVTSA
uniref:Senescence-associated protein n=1 Tax=Salix viminalis TaxID=40686 RepID=A0A6N2KK79_SALVM